MKLCKIRYDGNHYLAQPYNNITNGLFNDEEILINDCVITDNKRDLFVSEWYNENSSIKKKKNKKKNKRIEKLNTEFKRLFYIAKETMNKEKQIIKFIYDAISSDMEFVEEYSIRLDTEDIILMKYIKEFVVREKENLKSRKQLFRRKALNNDWNYFVTFTYDNSKHDEESFLKTLKKKLQNLHTNYGWLYMGCFERSKSGRLHFHGLLYVPEGKMRGSIRKEEYYDITSYKKGISFINEEFEDKIGRNDFKEITTNDLTFKNALEYILKYIGKSDNKIVYSRGIRDDFYTLINFDDNVICKLYEKAPYYIIANTEMIEFNKKLDLIS